MPKSDAKSIDELVQLLEEADSESVLASVRQPASLRKALRVAVAMGMDTNANDATNRALRDRLEAFAQRIALEQHDHDHPEARPSLAEVARTLAELEANPLAQHPQLFERAAREVVHVRPEADADDVLLWAESLAAHKESAPARRGRARA